MSLLLDALKKAAQDKQKAVSGATAPAVADAVQNPAEPALEFDLAQVEEHVPAVEQAQPPVAEDLPELSLEVQPPKSEIRPAAQPAAETRKIIEPEVPLSLQQEVETPQKAESKVEVAPAMSQTPAAEALAVKPRAPIASAAKQQGALDMMINKSRQAHEKQKNMLITGSLAIAVLLLLSATAYFYFDAGAEYQPQPTDIPPLETAASVVESVNTLTAETTVQPPPVVAEKTMPAPAAEKPRRNIVKDAGPVSAAAVTFTKKTEVDPVESLLSRAYEKFNAGDYEGANALYQQVLQREPNNRDGLLGVAAVAVKQQRNEYARQKYLQLLNLDPKDSIARAGLATVAGDAQDESQLKLMLREQPEAAHLYFALGSLYASQQRWSEAQQAFFSAWTGDSSNADYAYNLGVSLDRMGKFKAAAAQYQIALQLHNKRAGSFAPGELESRIQIIGNMTDE